MSLESYLTEIGQSDRPVAVFKLERLSDLPPEEMASFSDAWATMDVDRKRQILNRLVELAEENPSLNFDSIFMKCLQDADETVRLRAIEGLWECENRGLIDEFATVLKEDSAESVRAAAAIALGRFAMLAELGKLRPEDKAKVENVLFHKIAEQQEGPEVARRAVEAVSPLSLRKVTETIQWAYDSDSTKMRVSAIYAMGRNCDAAWLPVLLNELRNADPEMRYEAANACGELGEEDAVPYLRRLVDDSDSEVCLSAIAALGRIGGSEAEETLHACLSHPDELIRDAAAEALEELSAEKDPFSFRIE